MFNFRPAARVCGRKINPSPSWGKKRFAERKYWHCRAFNLDTRHFHPCLTCQIFHQKNVSILYEISRRTQQRHSRPRTVSGSDSFFCVFQFLLRSLLKCHKCLRLKNFSDFCKKLIEISTEYATKCVVFRVYQSWTQILAKKMGTSRTVRWPKRSFVIRIYTRCIHTLKTIQDVQKWVYLLGNFPLNTTAPVAWPCEAGKCMFLYPFRIVTSRNSLSGR